MNLHDDIIALEKKRCDAMLAKDTAALDTVLHPGLLFSHASGSVEGKQAYLAKVAGGRIDYRSIDWSEAEVADLGNTALLSGRMTSEVGVEGNVKRLDNRVLCVWHHDGDAWRLIAFQPTPLRV